MLSEPKVWVQVLSLLDVTYNAIQKQNRPESPLRDGAVSTLQNRFSSMKRIASGTTVKMLRRFKN